MKISQLFKILTPLAFLAVSACGGGGDSSSGGGSQHNGTYNGSETFTLTGASGSGLRFSGPIIIVINNGEAAINDGGNVQKGTISGDTFTIVYSGFRLQGLTCSGDIVYTGKVSGTNVAGSSVGRLACRNTSSGATGVVNFNGTFNAARTGAAARQALSTSSIKLMDADGSGVLD